METKEQELTEVEKRWIRLLSDGKSTSDVAKEVGLPAGTFAYKLNMLRARFQCRNMAALMAHLYKNKLID